MSIHPGSLYFGEWLDAYDGDDLAIADLRDDFKRVYRFRDLGPLDYKTPSSVDWEMRCWQGCSEAFDAFHKAAEIYYAQPGAWSRPTE
jgi:hypothetical protein